MRKQTQNKHPVHTKHPINNWFSHILNISKTPRKQILGASCELGNGSIIVLVSYICHEGNGSIILLVSYICPWTPMKFHLKCHENSITIPSNPLKIPWKSLWNPINPMKSPFDDHMDPRVGGTCAGRIPTRWTPGLRMSRGWNRWNRRGPAALGLEKPKKIG